MNLYIKTKRMDDGDYIAEVDWRKGDAASVSVGNIPAPIAYGSTAEEAYNELKNTLTKKGHTVKEER